MSTEETPDPSCEVCGRRLLPGERATSYVTRDRTVAGVCELCKPRAEAAGWMLPEEADATSAGGGGRERRRPRGQMLGGLLARLPAAANGEQSDAGHEAEAAELTRASPGAARRPRPARPRRIGSGALRVGPPATAPASALPEALLAFNASDHRRTVAGLTRTLGAPRATASRSAPSGGYPGARLTVAWELTWYQWEVGPGPRGPEVRESGKGETIDQLGAADRTWNLMVDTDGTLEKRSAATPGRDRGSVKLTVHVDGGARGNPGPAAIAAVVTDADGEILARGRRDDRPGDQQRRRVPSADPRHRARSRARGDGARPRRRLRADRQAGSGRVQGQGRRT